MNCMGSNYYETPNIDRIAAGGMIFTNGYANCQVCSPSRASIMSGKFPPRHGITDWIGARTGEDWRLAGRHTQLLPPEYDEELERRHLEQVINERWPRLERQRLEFLSEDFDPGNNRWGSQLAK